MLPLFLSITAQAASNELSLELGALHAPDRDFSAFSDNQAVTTWGARYGMGLTDHTAILLDWQHRTLGGAVSANDETATFYSALSLDQFAVGPRFGIPLGQGILPYVTVQVDGVRGRVRFDEDIDSTNDLNEIKQSAITAGAQALAGGMLTIGDEDDAVRLSGHLEMGYGYHLPLAFEDFGSLDFHGFALRLGAGVVF